MKFETTANLSQKSIDSLIKDLKNYSQEIKKSKKYVLQALSEYTQKRAKYHLQQSLIHLEESTGQLSDSINIQYISDEVAKVYTDMYYAAFVEFGTGARGIESEYGSKMFGDIPYQTEYLSGQPAHRYMYNAVMDLKVNYITIAKRVLKERGLI
jgi:HK97 gp10 family phage protein